MTTSTVATSAPDATFSADAISQDKAAEVRARHQELVEAWLDFAMFADELFKLHSRHNVEECDPGYAAYRKHLRLKLEKRLRQRGLTVDPLNEGCQCPYCQANRKESSPATPTPAKVEKNHPRSRRELVNRWR
ncbi:MAG: hypothetical protein NXI22_14210 [bacterium]|nr:hypothetical protein [bacterium]